MVTIREINQRFIILTAKPAAVGGYRTTKTGGESESPEKIREEGSKEGLKEGLKAEMKCAKEAEEEKKKVDEPLQATNLFSTSTAAPASSIDNHNQNNQSHCYDRY